MAFSTTSFINISGPYFNAIVVSHNFLSATRGISTDNANSRVFCNIFGDSQQLRNGFEGDALIILIKSSDNDSLSSIGQSLTYFYQISIEKLPFIYSNNL